MLHCELLVDGDTPSHTRSVGSPKLGNQKNKEWRLLFLGLSHCVMCKRGNHPEGWSRLNSLELLRDVPQAGLTLNSHLVCQTF